MNRPKLGAVEERTAPIGEASAPTIDGRKLRSMIPYGVESRDMGGWREVIDKGAVDADTRLADLIATREHSRAHLLGRHPTTLTTEDRTDGFHWAADLPSSPVGEDVRVAVERGDLRSSSWRMVVARDRWDGNVRHVQKIAELLDVTVTAAPAYAAAAAELRSQPDPANGQEDKMATEAETAATTATTETSTAANTAAEERSTTTTGGLQVQDRVTVTNEPARGLADEFETPGFRARRPRLASRSTRTAPSSGAAASTTSRSIGARPATWAMTSAGSGRWSRVRESTPEPRAWTCSRSRRGRSPLPPTWSARSTRSPTSRRPARP